MSKITKYLNQLITGNVFDTPEILNAYSTDRSALKIMPKLVALPESTDDIRKLMKFFTQLASKDIRVPIAIRGSGLDEMGADLSNGLVISTEKLNHLMEIEPRERLVRVQAGITLKELNTALSVSGLTLPIGANPNETIGGLIANGSIDNYAKKYGGIMNYVERAEIILTNGECVQTNRLSKYMVAKKTATKSLEGEIYRKLYKMVQQNSVYLNQMSNRRVDLAGYPGIAQAKKKDTFDLLPIIFGSEGTLGVISEVILRAVPISKRPARIVATFPKLEQAIKYMSAVVTLNPRELNIYDLRILKSAEETGKNLSKFTRKLEYGFIVYTSVDEKQLANLRKITALSKTFPHSVRFVFESPEDRSALDEFDNSLINFLNYPKNGERVSLLSNFSLPAKNIEKFVEDLAILEDKLKLHLLLFGSFATANYSLRPAFSVSDPEFPKKAVTFLKTGSFVIERQGGSITAGAPEGRIKALVSNSKIPETEKNLFNEVKNIFDKNGILNPGVKLQADPRFVIRHFRTSSAAKIVI